LNCRSKHPAAGAHRLGLPQTPEPLQVSVVVPLVTQGESVHRVPAIFAVGPAHPHCPRTELLRSASH
jgi:hypothetical protein